MAKMPESGARQPAVSHGRRIESMAEQQQSHQNGRPSRPGPPADPGRVAEILLEISRLISSSLDVGDTYDEFARLVNELIPFDRIIIAAVDIDSDRINPLYIAGIYMPGPGPGMERPLSRTPFHEVATEKTTLVLDAHGTAEVLERYPDEVYGTRVGLRSLMGVPLISNDEVTGVLIIRSKLERAYGERETRLAEGVAAQIAGAIASSRLHAHTQTVAHEREVLADLARIISSSLDIDEVYDQFATQAHKLVGFDRIVISAIDTEKGTVTPVYSAGLRVPGWEVGTVHPLAGSEIERVVERRETTISTERPHTDALNSGISTPLTSRDEVIGVLILNSFDENSYSAADVRLVEEIADRVAPAIQNARVYRQSREIAVLEERNRIAREIHDSLAQGLTGIIWQLNAVLSEAEQNPEYTARQIEQIRDLARECLQEARRSVYDLRSGPLQGRSFIEAVREEGRRLTNDGRTQVKVSISGHRVQLPSTLEAGAFRICQEALNNVRRHSNANECSIRLIFRKRSLELTVQDNGTGFDPEEKSGPDESGGFGLISMRERTRLLGGDFELETARGSGTAIRAVLPTG